MLLLPAKHYPGGIANLHLIEWHTDFRTLFNNKLFKKSPSHHYQLYNFLHMGVADHCRKYDIISIISLPCRDAIPVGDEEEGRINYWVRGKGLILWVTALVAAGVVILTEFHQESPANNITGRAKSKEKRINKNNKGGQSQVFNGDRWIRTSPSDTAPEFL